MARAVLDRVLLVASVIVVSFVPLSFGLTPGLRTAWFQALVVTLVAHVVSGRAVFDRRVAWWVGLSVLAIAAAVVTAGAADAPVAHRRAAATIVLVWLLAAPVVARLVARPSDLRAVVGAFVVGQTVSAVVGTVAVLAGDPTLGATAEPGRAYGLAGHPNVLALCASAVCVLALHRPAPPTWFRRAGRFAPSWSGVLAGVVAVNGAVIVWSGSMSVALALVTALAVDLAVRRCDRRSVATTVGGAAAIVVVSAAIAAAVGTRTPWSRFEQAVGQAPLESSLSERWRTWGFALREIADRPLHGVGLDEASGVTDVNDLVVHQLVLRGWYQGGPLLGMAMAAIVVSMVVLVVRAVRRGRVGPAPAILTLYATFSSTSAALQQPYVWLVLLTAWFATAAATAATAPGPASTG